MGFNINWIFVRGVCLVSSQKDAPKYFYDSIEPSDKNLFATIHEGKTANGPDSITNEEKVTFESLSDEAESSNMKVLSKLRGKPLGLHQKSLMDVIGSLEDKLKTEIKQDGSKKSGRSTAEKSQGKSTPKSARSKDNNAISFSCTELLLDKIMLHHQKIKPAKQIEFVAVIVSAKDIMLQEIRESLFPFCVEIKHLQNLPSYDLSLTHLFLKYSLENAFTEETDRIEITQDNYKHLEFNHSKVLFINRMEIPFSLFVEALQTGLFYIELYGVATSELKISTNTPQKAIKGDSVPPEKNRKKQTKSSKEKRSKKAKKKDVSSNILLAVAYVNLCEMLKSTLWTDYNTHLTANLPFDCWWNRSECHDEKILQEEGKVAPYFKQKHLMECGTIMKIRLRNGDLIQPPLLANILSQREILSRLIIVFHENDTNDVIWDTLNINSTSIDNQEFIKPRITPDSLISIAKDLYSYSVSSEEMNEINYISGFLIDTLEKKFLMVEGLANFKFFKILGIVSRLKYNKKVKIFFNSSFIFTERLYPDPHQRFTHVIKLRKPLSSVMRLPYSELKRKLSSSVLKAMTKLTKMVNCYTIHEVCVQRLFPSPDEISAMEIELGIQFPKDNFALPIIQRTDFID
ncbi:uncharacterized protein LOC111050461 isoform X2 [Nilaparvata lugens]|uniref:uncharacterized protein LOC111050461 isoform X2 n=1 Tax=Nilaparvata lugens TaxID=108931 RepID=UPI00193D38CA|nr:uncharacterized protein LOC111050461 isoform X2 [Nilaparvata lugens]